MKAALTRFADLSFNVRPSKCRPYMLSLLPCLVHASQRDEEIIQDVLGPAVQVGCAYGNLCVENLFIFWI